MSIFKNMPVVGNHDIVWSRVYVNRYGEDVTAKVCYQCISYKMRYTWVAYSERHGERLSFFCFTTKESATADVVNYLSLSGMKEKRGTVVSVSTTDDSWVLSGAQDLCLQEAYSCGDLNAIESVVTSQHMDTPFGPRHAALIIYTVLDIV